MSTIARLLCFFGLHKYDDWNRWFKDCPADTPIASRKCKRCDKERFGWIP